MQGSIIQLLRLNSSMIRLRRCNHLHVIAQASIHAPHGRDILVIAVSRSITVSIHAPTRGATRCSALRHLDTCVSIHAPTRGATPSSVIYLSIFHVSIHAPTRGATFRMARQVFWIRFNPRAHTGRDLLPFSIVFISMRFNPRAHTGRDPEVDGIELQKLMFQSTRPHGARQPRCPRHSPTGCFNPRAHTGRD